MTSPAAAVILAGGRGRRLGGTDKPALRLGDSSLLDIALAAVIGCPRVVVGPARELPAGVIAVSEDPPGGGPAAGVAAGINALPVLSPDAIIAVLAADLPGITSDTIARLCAALQGSDGPSAPGGAVLLDPGGRRQYLLGVWRHNELARAVRQRAQWQGAPLRELLDPVRVVEIAGSERETADVDTPEDWRRWQS